MNGAVLRSLWITDSSPADLSSPGDNADAEVGIINHDYVIVQKGTVVLVLDDRSKTPVGEGDIVVQQGTMHGWDNPTDEWVCLLVILLPAKAPVVAGKALKTDVSSLGM
ncbi:hypothetical protein DER46DRAFT_660911 [Fusarium sp. MPI-SDFR-AT-0072]|nr:hypothetical protein DER46DRAFT_660911 [Fusarium sp. MPI-SDFR-AT-0072]